MIAKEVNIDNSKQDGLIKLSTVCVWVGPKQIEQADVIFTWITFRNQPPILMEIHLFLNLDGVTHRESTKFSSVNEMINWPDQWP